MSGFLVRDQGEGEMTSTYNYVRFRWWNPLDLDKVVEEFPGFKTKKVTYLRNKAELAIQRDARDEVVVEADTLKAFLSPFRAVLNQKEDKPFTARDMALRERVMKFYSRSSPTPFPWEFSSEPSFEKEKPEG
jgi:hypothetical protein